MTDDDNGQKPSLRLVSENPNAAADKVAREVQYAKAEAERALAAAAASLLRVMAGAGNTFEMRRDMINALLAEDHLKELSGEWLSDWEKKKILADPLKSELPSTDDEYRYREFRRNRNFETIMQGSLRLAAHRVLGEQPHFGGKYSEALIERGINAIAPPTLPKPLTKKEQAEKQAARATLRARIAAMPKEPPARKKPWSSRNSQSYRDTKPDEPST